MKSKSLHWGLRLGVASTFAVHSFLANADMPGTVTVGDSLISVSSPQTPDTPLNQGYAYVEAGKYRQALLEFDRALAQAKARNDVGQEAEIYGATGYTLYLFNQPEVAKKQLAQALDMAVKNHDTVLEGRVRAYLGLIHAQSQDTAQQAKDEFERSQTLARANNDTAMELAASLQLARLEPSPAKHLEKLQTLSSSVLTAGIEKPTKVNLLLNLTDQLKHMLEPGKNPTLTREIRKLGHSVAEKAASLAAEAGLPRAQSQIEGFQAGLYEREGKTEEAIALIRPAIQHAAQANASDLGMAWQTALGHLLDNQGQQDQAIEAYRRAVFYVGEIRNDIPVTYQDGKSSYTETLEPIYRGLADLLLRKAPQASQPEEAQSQLMEAINTLERLKQSEMEDYFNDRCALESTPSTLGSSPHVISKFALQSTSSGASAKIASLEANLNKASGKTAIIYPIIFDDRLEVLFIHNGVIHQHTTQATREQVTKQILTLNNMLRGGGAYRQILNGSHQLYQWMLEPSADLLRTSEVDRLVYIPDGKLRLAPLAVLYDGKHFVAENYSVVTNSGLQFTPAHVEGKSVGKALLAGLSVPDGPSLEQIPDELFISESNNSNPSRGFEEDYLKTTRQARGSELKTMKSAPGFREKAVQMLSLPGVTEEIRTIEAEMPNTTLLNQTFTSKNLEDGIQSGEYELVHISSHGYFGHSADDSFILTYDKALGVSEVERIMRLKPGQGQGHSIDLVTFSACQTAQGDDRAPLGFSGLAIKANALHALGSLWPINDKATKQFMSEYYAALASNNGDSVKALQKAQKALISVQSLAHPSYWAAFVLVGAW